MLRKAIVATIVPQYKQIYARTRTRARWLKREPGRENLCHFSEKNGIKNGGERGREVVKVPGLAG